MRTLRTGTAGHTTAISAVTAETEALPTVGDRVRIIEGRWGMCVGRLDMIDDSDAVVDLGDRQVRVAPSMLRVMPW